MKLLVMQFSPFTRHLLTVYKIKKLKKEAKYIELLKIIIIIIINSRRMKLKGSVKNVKKMRNVYLILFSETERMQSLGRSRHR
jgi:hypothetical protein